MKADETHRRTHGCRKKLDPIPSSFPSRPRRESIEGEIASRDVEGLKGTRFALYDHFSGTVRAAGRNARLPVRLPEFGCALYIISPIQRGFAPLGLVEKYISPKAILSCRTRQGAVGAELAEGGTFACYSERSPVGLYVDGKELSDRKWHVEDDLLRISVPMKRSGSRRTWVEIHFPQ